MFRRKEIFFVFLLVLFVGVFWQSVLIVLTLIDLFIGISSDLTFEMSRPSRIPPLIHQMWKTSNLSTYPINTSNELWKSFYPDYKVRLWTDDDIQRLISSKNYSFLKRTFDSYSFNIQRADLARLLILYDQGGFYADLDVFPSSRRSIDEIRFSGASFVIPRSTTDKSLINHFLASESHSAILNFILHEVVEKKFYQRIFLLPYLEVFSTGSSFLTRVIRQWHRMNKTDEERRRTLWIMSNNLVNTFILHDVGRSWHLFDGFLLNKIDYYFRLLNRWFFSSIVFVFLLTIILIKSRRWFRLVVVR